MANSNAMELEGLKRCMARLTEEGKHISDLTTDRHPQVIKYCREKHPTIKHWFDIWHVSKGMFLPCCYSFPHIANLHQTSLNTYSKKYGKSL